MRRTWRALLALKKADIDEREENGEMDRMTERAVVFRKDGGWARVPAIDTVRVAPGRRMIVPVTEAGDALDHEGVVIIEDQLFEVRLFGSLKFLKRLTTFFSTRWRRRA